MSESIRVLLVEDSPSDAKLVLHELKRAGFEVVHERVEEAEPMREALQRGGWDAVISDWSMPRFSGLAALQTLKDSRVDLPFILASGTVGEETAVSAMRAGAHDFVVKDRLGRLGPALRREMAEARMRTARKQAEAALMATQQRFVRLAESGIVGIAVIDVATDAVVDANDAYLGMIGYTRDELLEGTLRWRGATPEDWLFAEAAALEKLKTHGVAPAWEKELLRKDGSRTPMLVGLVSETYPRCLAFVADLHELREIKRAHRETEIQLRQSQKMEAVGLLAGGIAHDFNNLLAVILSYSDLLLRDLSAGTQPHQDLQEIRDAAKRAAALTRQLLLFSRKQVLTPEQLDLNDVVLSIEKMLRRMVGEDVTLRTVMADRPATVLADPGQMEQVLMNLMVNARDAMPRGGTLTVATRNVELGEPVVGQWTTQAGPHVLLSVSDTGLGMSEAVRTRIFEPFFTTKGPGKGTGLGLSTVAGIVREMGGAIAVESAEGQGTTFNVYFPRTNGAVAGVHARASASFDELRGTESVLVVEDDASVRGLTRDILIRAGYRVREARDAAEALQLCSDGAERFQLMLSDVVMPNMSGPELAKALLRSRPDLKLVFMSGYIDDTVIRHGLTEANALFVQKPFTPMDLLHKVREALAG